MKEATRGNVLAALLRHRPASRKRLAQATGVSPATVSRTVDQLIDAGLVREGPALVEERRGRRQVLLDIVGDQRFVVGVDLGASRTRCVVADMTARPLACIEIDTPVHLDAAGLAAWIARATRQAAGARWDKVATVALGIPGAVASEHRHVSNAPNLPQIEVDGFLSMCEASLERLLVVDNDANYALLGEQHFGAAAGVASGAMVTLGAGLGVGLSVDGHLLQGKRGLVGEFGQLRVGPDGARLETMVTGPSIVRRAVEAGLDLDQPADLFRPGGPPEARPLREQFDRAFIVVLSAVAVACDPDVIVIGGGIAKSLRAELDDYQRELTQALHVAPRLAYTALDDYAGASGAVVAALHRVYVDLGVPETDLPGLPPASTAYLSELDHVRS